MQETSTPESMSPTSMEGRRLWYSHSSNSKLAITSYMRKAQPIPWWACRIFTQVMLSNALASLLAKGSNLSAPGTSNCVETWRQLLPTSVKCTMRWWLHGTFIRHLPAWPCKTFETISQSLKGSMTKSMQSVKPMKCTERLRSCKDLKKESTSHKSKKVSKLLGQKGASQLLRSGEHRSTKDAAKKSCWADCCSMSSSVPTHSCLATTVNECSFYLWKIPHSFPRWSHIVFLSKPSLSQTNCLILYISHSCCGVLVFISYNYPGILFHILYWLLTILTYTLHRMF